MSTDASTITLADYAELDDPDGGDRADLVAGVLVREPRPAPRHGRIQALVARILGNWAAEHEADVTVESGYVLSEEPATLLGPDVAVVLRGQAREETDGWTRGAPDVAVEVVSPSDTSSHVQRKILAYLGAGARLVWIIDPDARTVTVYRPDGSAHVLGEAEILRGVGVLVGFEVAVTQLLDCPASGPAFPRRP
jgi:Uma2 family endonuclease